MIFILLTLLVLDSIYLTFHFTFFQTVFKKIQHTPLQFRILPAMFVYACLTLLVYKLVQYKVSDLDTFLIGLCVYGIYEGTNYATLQSWPLYMFVVDTLWGGILLYLTIRFNRLFKNYIR